MRGLVVVVVCIAGCGDNGAPGGLAQSTVTVDRADGVVADGIDTVHVTVSVVDAAGAPVAGCTVTPSVSGSANSIAPMPATDAGGTSSTTLASTIAETKTVAASVQCGANGALTAIPATVEFVHGPIARLEYLVQPASTDAGVTLSPAIVLETVDAFGNIADEPGNVAIELATNPGSVTATGTKTVALAGGIAMFDDLRVLVPGQGYTLEATSSLVPMAASSDPFDIGYGDPSSMSTLELAPPAAEADGVSAIAARVTIVNAGGVPIPGLPVSVTMSGTGGDVFPVAGTTDALGRFQTQLTSTIAETKTVTATSGALVLTAHASFVAPCKLMFPALPSMIVPSAASSSFASDLDGDGHPDLAIAEPSSVAILRGVGDGRLHTPYRYSSGTGTVAVTGGDLDHDGDIDLVVANKTTSSLLVFANQGDGQFLAPTTITLPDPPMSITAGDLDGNGTVDLAVRTQLTVVILLGAGNGTFGAPASYPLGFSVSISVVTIALADIDGDTRPDVVTVGTNSQLSILLANANGTLQAPVTTFVGDYWGGAIAVADFNSDTRLDVVFTGTSGTYLGLGQGDGHFTLGPAFGFFGGRGALAADVNMDGKPDVVTATSASVTEVSLWLGNGNGSFQPPQVFALNQGALAMTLSDFNGDGRLDLAVCEGDQAGLPAAVSVLLGTPAGSLLGTPYIGDVPGGTRAYYWDVAGDFDGNGMLDLVAQSAIPPNDSGVMLAAADGTFTAAPRVSVIGSPALAGDFDGDGKLDVVFGSNGAVRFTRGNGDGTLQAPVTTTVSGFFGGMDKADFNHDGKLDLAIANQMTNSVVIAFGNGDGTFGNLATYPVGARPQGVLAIDLDGDGNVELVVSNRNSASVSVLEGSASGAFAPAVSNPVAGTPMMAAPGDFDGNGTIDLAIATGATTTISLLAGNGDTTFAPEVRIDAGVMQDWIGTTDVDGDGILDLVAGTRGVLVLRGFGGGTFGPPVLYDAGATGSPTILRDFDGDGRSDVVMAGTNPQVGFAFLHDRGCQ